MWLAAGWSAAPHSKLPSSASSRGWASKKTHPTCFVESAGKRFEGNLNYSMFFPEILLVPVRLFFPSFKYHPALTMMARFYGARLVEISSSEFVEHIWSLPYCTNTFPLKRKQCTTRFRKFHQRCYVSLGMVHHVSSFSLCDGLRSAPNCSPSSAASQSPWGFGAFPRLIDCCKMY